MGILPDMRVLLVDDSLTVRVGVSAALRGEGFEVRTSSTVAEGYDLAVEWKPDVVLLDVMILRADGSGGGGLQLLRWIKRSLPSLPVVMYSGEKDQRSRKAAETSGASGYAVKGCPIPALADILRKVVEDGVRSIGHRPGS